MDELRENYIKKFSIKKVVIGKFFDTFDIFSSHTDNSKFPGCDGLIFEHLVSLYNDFGDQYRSFLPYLGKPTHYYLELGDQ